MRSPSAVPQGKSDGGRDKTVKRQALLLSATLLVATALSSCGSQSTQGSHTNTTPGTSTYEKQIQELAGQTVDVSKYQHPGPYTIAILTQGAFNGYGKVF